ncbi:MAG TPA: UDP-glucose 4-epimerase GalE [Alphaproteobacteria bacterium]|nr:UDP-glucose 4-epimerase GalE [Alphaproteobacteria bacterium]
MTDKPAIFVTGGAGYVGSHACLALEKAGFTPIAFDNLSAGDKNRVKFGPFVEGDIKSPLSLMAAIRHYKPVAVMHFAGLISVGDSVKNPLSTYHNNVTGTLALLAAMKETGVKHMVFSSSAAVYGAPEATPIAENAPKAPLSPYGQTKLMAETILADCAAAGLLNYTALRYFNAAGATPEQGLGYNRADPTHLIPLALQTVLGKRPALEIFGNDYNSLDGTAVRDYVHVADLAEAHVAALKYLLAGGESVALNLGTSKGHSVLEVLAEVEKVTGKSVARVMRERRMGDAPVLVADAQLSKKVLDWSAKGSDLSQIIASDWAWHQTL